MKLRLKKIVACALILALGSVVANATPVEWTVASGGNGNFYEFFDDANITWDDANDAAQLLTHDGTATGVPGHLATLTSAAEDLFVDGERATAGLGQAWIGGVQADDQTAEGDEWSWVNGEGSIPGVDSAAPYADWGDNNNPPDIEPNDAGGAAGEDNSENHLALGRYGVGGGWNDERPANIAGYIVEYDFASRFVPPGPGGIFSTGASTGYSGAYQNVLVGGNVSINCCVVQDTREGTGTGKKYGDYDPVELDLGDEIDNTASCVDLRVYGGVFGSNKAVLRPWQRGIPRSGGTGGPNDIGVCLVQSEAIAQGVIFSAEDTLTVLGFSLDCGATEIEDRPFTGGVAIDPTELDSPNVVRITAECNGSRSAKRGSDNLIVLNLRHYTKHNATKPYLSRLAGTLLDAIAFKSRLPDPLALPFPDPGGCVDNSEFFADNLTDLVETAKENFRKKGDGDTAVEALDNATKLALLIPGTVTVPTDPYASCTENQQGLFVGRLMALKHATCSEIVEKDSDAQAPTRCAIETNIRAEMPSLP